LFDLSIVLVKCTRTKLYPKVSGLGR